MGTLRVNRQLGCGCAVWLYPPPRLREWLICPRHGTTTVAAKIVGIRGSIICTRTTHHTREETAVDVQEFAKLASKPKPSSHKPQSPSGRKSSNPADNPLWEAFAESIDQRDDGEEAWTGQPMEIVIPDTDEAKHLARALVARAARDAGTRYRARLADADEKGKTTLVFWALHPADEAVCPECGKEVPITSQNTLRTHGPRDNRCAGSGREVVDDTDESDGEDTPTPVTGTTDNPAADAA